MKITLLFIAVVFAVVNLPAQTTNSVPPILASIRQDRTNRLNQIAQEKENRESVAQTVGFANERQRAKDLETESVRQQKAEQDANERRTKLSPAITQVFSYTIQDLVQTLTNISSASVQVSTNTVRLGTNAGWLFRFTTSEVSAPEKVPYKSLSFEVATIKIACDSTNGETDLTVSYGVNWEYGMGQRSGSWTDWPGEVSVSLNIPPAASTFIKMPAANCNAAIDSAIRQLIANQDLSFPIQ